MNPKILIFIDWYKPGFKAGGPIRSISNLVSQFNNEYEFYIVTRDTDYLETTPYNSIEKNKWNSVDKAKVYYISSNNVNKANIRNLIKEVNPDYIYCNSLYSPKFTLIPTRIAKKLNIKTILAVRGMLSDGSLSVKKHKKKVFLTFVKSTGLFNKVIFHATSQQEKNDIEKHFGTNKKIIVAPNLPGQKNIHYQIKSKDKNILKMVFIGRVAPEKNTKYAIESLKECTNNIELDIYGPIYNQEYFTECENAINQLPNNIVVSYKGAFNHNSIDIILKNYHVIFQPSTGENFGHSILEGMANSCVPLISDKTPWNNLEEKNVGFDLSLNDKSLFSKKIDYIAELNDIDFNKISKNAYLYAQSIINDEKLKEEYLNLFS